MSSRNGRIPKSSGDYACSASPSTVRLHRIGPRSVLSRCRAILRTRTFDQSGSFAPKAADIRFARSANALSQGASRQHRVYESVQDRSLASKIVRVVAGGRFTRFPLPARNSSSSSERKEKPLEAGALWRPFLNQNGPITLGLHRHPQASPTAVGGPAAIDQYIASIDVGCTISGHEGDHIGDLAGSWPYVAVAYDEQ